MKNERTSKRVAKIAANWSTPISDWVAVLMTPDLQQSIQRIRELLPNVIPGVRRQANTEFLMLCRLHIEAILERNWELEAVWARLLACHEDDAGICFDCRKELTRAGLLEAGNLGAPAEEWQKYFDMLNQVNTLTLRVEELEAENARLKAGACVGCGAIVPGWVCADCTVEAVRAEREGVDGE